MLTGRQIILDLYNCDFNLLSQQNNLEILVQEIMSENNVPFLSSFSQAHEDNSFSTVHFHSFGHIIVHTFPDTGFASVDIFATVSNIALERIAIKIKQTLRSEKSKNTYLRRGDFGSLRDMKPTVHKQVKTWRRVRNTSAKMFGFLKRKKLKTK